MLTNRIFFKDVIADDEEEKEEDEESTQESESKPLTETRASESVKRRTRAKKDY